VIKAAANKNLFCRPIPLISTPSGKFQEFYHPSAIKDYISFQLKMKYNFP
jgi:hypothetical protein